MELNDTYKNLRQKRLFVTTIFILQFIILFPSLVFSQPQDSVRTILERKDNFKAIDILKGDTLKKETPKQDKTNLPGGTADTFTPDQDSAYYRALKLRLPISSRLNQSLDELAVIINARVEQLMALPGKLQWQILILSHGECSYPAVRNRSCTEQTSKILWRLRWADL